MRRPILTAAFSAAVLIAVGCSDSGQKNTAVPLADGLPTPEMRPSASPTPSPSKSGSPAGDEKAEALEGRWQGPEGTYLNITRKPEAEDKDGDKYNVEIANLDGPKTYEGTAKGDVIEFIRDGKTETVKAATGAETGMKYLANETNCVVVTKGSEGFCRKS